MTTDRTSYLDRSSIPFLEQEPDIIWEKYRLLVLLYIIIISTTIFILFYDWNFDDAYITFRYASNLANGQGFVYNLGLRVQSTTTPLFTFILAAFSFIWDDFPHLANLLGSIGIGLGTYFLWELCVQKKLILAGFTCLILYPTFPLLVSTIGLESSLYISFCLGSIYFYEKQRYANSAVYAALTCLMRPDGILVPIFLLGHFVLTHHRRPPMKPVFIFFGLLLPWLIFSIIYFGTPIPATLTAKQNQGTMMIGELFGPGIVTILKPYSQRLIYVIEFILGLIGLTVVLLKKLRGLLILYVWTAGYYLTYSLLGVTRYQWYYAPLVPAFIISVGLGLMGINQLLHKISLQYSKQLSTIVSGFFLVVLGAGQIQHLLNIMKIPDQRREIYRAIGEWLSENTDESDLVGTLEVGMIGYYSSRPILDFAGLIQPEVGFRLGPTLAYEDAAIWATETYHPYYLVLPAGFSPKLELGIVSRYCNKVKNFKGNDFGYSGEFNIFECAFSP